MLRTSQLYVLTQHHAIYLIKQAFVPPFHLVTRPCTTIQARHLFPYEYWSCFISSLTLPSAKYSPSNAELLSLMDSWRQAECKRIAWMYTKNKKPNIPIKQARRQHLRDTIKTACRIFASATRASQFAATKASNASSRGAPFLVPAAAQTWKLATIGISSDQPFHFCPLLSNDCRRQI